MRFCKTFEKDLKIFLKNIALRASIFFSMLSCAHLIHRVTLVMHNFSFLKMMSWSAQIVVSFAFLFSRALQNQVIMLLSLPRGSTYLWGTAAVLAHYWDAFQLPNNKIIANVHCSILYFTSRQQLPFLFQAVTKELKHRKHVVWPLKTTSRTN